MTLWRKAEKQRSFINIKILTGLATTPMITVLL